MSLYNLLHGMNATAVMLLSPFAPTRIDNFPRFRNVFLEDEDAPNPADFYVYTRMGGGNCNCYAETCYADLDDCGCGACYALELESSQYCVDRYDDGFDCTYCTFSFHVSNEDQADFEVVKSALMQGACPTREQLSERYVAKLEEMYALELEKIRASGQPMAKIADAPV